MAPCQDMPYSYWNLNLPFAVKCRLLAMSICIKRLGRSYCRENNMEPIESAWGRLHRLNDIARHGLVSVTADLPEVVGQLVYSFLGLGSTDPKLEKIEHEPPFFFHAVTYLAGISAYDNSRSQEHERIAAVF